MTVGPNGYPVMATAMPHPGYHMYAPAPQQQQPHAGGVMLPDGRVPMGMGGEAGLAGSGPSAAAAAATAATMAAPAGWTGYAPAMGAAAPAVSHQHAGVPTSTAVSAVSAAVSTGVPLPPGHEAQYFAAAPTGFAAAAPSSTAPQPTPGMTTGWEAPMGVSSSAGGGDVAIAAPAGTSVPMTIGPDGMHPTMGHYQHVPQAYGHYQQQPYQQQPYQQQPYQQPPQPTAVAHTPVDPAAPTQSAPAAYEPAAAAMAVDVADATASAPTQAVQTEGTGTSGTVPAAASASQE